MSCTSMPMKSSSRSSGSNRDLNLSWVNRIAASEERAVEIDPADRAPILQRTMFGIVRDGTVLEACDAGIIDDDVPGPRPGLCRWR